MPEYLYALSVERHGQVDEKGDLHLKAKVL